MPRIKFEEAWGAKLDDKVGKTLPDMLDGLASRNPSRGFTCSVKIRS